MAHTTRGDSQIWRLVQRQHGVVTATQLRSAGFTRSAITHRMRTGRLWRVHRGVFAVGRVELTQAGRWLAATLACGDGAALSHLSAAALWEIRESRPPRVHQVSVKSVAGKRGPRDVELHCAPSLRPTDITEKDAVPVTMLPRTLIDLATIIDDKGLKSALRQAERVHGLDLRRMRALLDDRPTNSPGAARLRRLLDDYVPASATDSDLEAVFLELCRKHGIPRPRTQVPIGRYRADFLWPDFRLVVEVDGRRAHDGYVAFREDRARDRAMKAAGFEVLRFADPEIRREDESVARDVLAALIRRGR